MNVIYVLENYNGSEGAFTSEYEMIKYALITNDDEMLACAVIEFTENSDEGRLIGNLRDYLRHDE